MQKKMIYNQLHNQQFADVFITLNEKILQNVKKEHHRVTNISHNSKPHIGQIDPQYNTVLLSIMKINAVQNNTGPHRLIY